MVPHASAASTPITSKRRNSVGTGHAIAMVSLKGAAASQDEEWAAGAGSKGSVGKGSGFSEAL